VELTPKQQTIELIKQAEKILVTTHKNPDGDAIGALITLKTALTMLGKKVTAVYPGELSAVFNFLPEMQDLKNSLIANRDFIITIDTSKIPSSEVKLGYKHDKQNNKLSVVVTPSKGIITKEDVSFGSTVPKFDLIIILDSPDLERLGALYDQFTELFYETPIINIDHHPSNDYFGKVSWVDLTATSTCEMLVSLLESLASQDPTKKLLTEDVATALLTGIVTDTGSFQNANTTPKSFTVAAQLVAAGARQQEIIKHIFKTKPLSTLKLWGRVLTNITEEAEPHFVWSKVTKSDINAVEAKPTELSGVVDELLKSTPNVEFALLISERPASDGSGDVLHGTLRAVSPSIDVSAIATALGGGGHIKAAAFEQPRKGSFDDQVKDVIAQVKKIAPQSTSDSTSALEMPTIE
jgi:phosphoesterase RecJ-like protein